MITPTDFNINIYLSDRKKIINDKLKNYFCKASPSLRITAAMEYSLMAGGKRLRPILCMAASEAVGGTYERALDIACAIEMIHTYSLIHDDLPAMDNDDLRRGKPTCHVKFDEATAILAGDALLTYAFQIISETGIEVIRDRGVPDDIFAWLEVTKCISGAAGHNGMVEGQMRDIASEKKKLDLTELEEMHGLKTGKLIMASVITGAMLGGGNSGQIEKLKEYSNKIGLAFQMVDDILNIEGEPITMGKAIGTDARLNKNTYPSLLGLEESKKLARLTSESALHSLSTFDNRAEPLRAIAIYIINRKM